MERRKLNRISALLLLLGLGSAVAIFLLAKPEEDNELLNDSRGARRYHRELRMIGGNANLLSAQFREWFDSLWHGQALAGTVAVLTVGTTLVFRYVATFPAAEDPATTATPASRHSLRTSSAAASNHIIG